MKEKDKVPEKIDMEDVLGPEHAREPAEIEILDPSTGEPLEDDANSAREPAGPVASGDSPDLELLRQEKDKYHDLWIHARADFENLRKRVERERESERTQAGAGLVTELLPVLDNLERALAGAPEGDPFRDGVALIHRSLRDCLLKEGLQPIEALGEMFNPLHHEAVATEASDRFEPNRILEEIRKGYAFRGRVIRPALVKVAVAGAAGGRTAPKDRKDTARQRDSGD